MIKIDFHTHCFPDRLAPRAMATLSSAAGGVKPQTDGTLGGLLSLMDSSGVEMAVVMNIATNTRQQTSVNNFAAEICGDRIMAFGSVHPDSENVFGELERIKALGLKGVKFHPEYQRFYVDDEKMRPIYKKISELGLVVLFHAGWDVGFPPPYHCMPQQLANALKMLDCPVVAAHWGGISVYDEVVKYLCGLPLWFDTSYGYSIIPRPYAEEIAEKHGAERLLFGSDTPWHSPSWESRLIESIGFSKSEKELIYHKNAEKLLGI